MSAPWRPAGLAARGDDRLVVVVADGGLVGHLWRPGPGEPSAAALVALLDRVHHPALPEVLDVLVGDDGHPDAVVVTPLAPPAAVPDEPWATARAAAARRSLEAALATAGGSLDVTAATALTWADGDLRVHDLSALTPATVGSSPAATPRDEAEVATVGGGPARALPTGRPHRWTRQARTLGLAAAAMVIGGLGLALHPGARSVDGAPARSSTAPSTVANAPSTVATESPDCAPAPDPEADLDAIAADVDGDGCADAATWDGATATLVVHTAADRGSATYRLGQPGDQLVLGDWDGDGVATPALYRPSTGRLATFPHWPDGGDDQRATSTDTGTRGGVARLVRRGGVDAVSVTPPVTSEEPSPAPDG